MKDPLRPEAKVAVELCRSAGIATVMITGDHKETALAIAREAGFPGGATQALSGLELNGLTDGESVRAGPGHCGVRAGIGEHKLRIVKAWRAQGAVVAMTGDGVNDAPAVREADIGIAMGLTGTDVTKDASDMVVTDDNFASIAAAVEEGRSIYDNIRKAVHYLLSCNLERGAGDVGEHVAGLAPAAASDSHSLDQSGDRRISGSGPRRRSERSRCDETAASRPASPPVGSRAISGCLSPGHGDGHW
jgi:Ca2+-transporting ATPase